MNTWKGEERRKAMLDFQSVKDDISNIRTDLSILINKVDNNHKGLRETIERNQALIDKIDKTIYGNGNDGLTTSNKRIMDSVVTLEKNLDSHTIWDRWIIGLIFAAQSGILLKLFIK